MDPLRVRVGPLIGELVNLQDAGIGQGKRAAVQLFGTLVRALTDNVCSSTVGVGIDVPRGAHQAMAELGGIGIDGHVQWQHVVGSVAGVSGVMDDERWRHAGGELRSSAERILFLDAVALNAWLMLQFVDDSFVAQSTLHGLRCVNRAMTAFCDTWRHRFKLGAKGPAVMAVGCRSPVSEACGDIQGSCPAVREKLLALGVWLDSRLALTDQMDMVCSKLTDGTRSLVRSMNDLGFGLPFQGVQLKQRVWASALHGAEVLASFGPGWTQAVKRLNDIHYAMAKLILGLRPTSHQVQVGTCGHSLRQDS
jgi:hypothetical protein